jgi:hypothetical protein
MNLNHHDIPTTPAPKLAVIVFRGVLAVTLPALLFSALAGACAAVAVRVFQFLTGG